jgi:hypothetical protein
MAAVPAHADNAHRITVHGTLHALTDVVTDTSLCKAQGGSYVPGALDYAYSGTSTYAGTFRGTGRFCGHSTGGPAADGSVPFTETDTFVGTVNGCGTGTVVYDVHGFIHPSLDLGRRALNADEDWRVVPRSGLKGLRGLRSGNGHDPAWINADTSIDADFLGVVTCARR